MIARATSDVRVDEVQSCGSLTILVVSLKGETHYEMWTNYCSLAEVLEYDGVKHGKTCWDSDKRRAYYRSDAMIARPCSC